MNRRKSILYTHSMIRLEDKYAEAIQFRKRGFTYTEIAKIVGVSKSTVSNWVSKKPFSKKIREENSARAARENVKRIGLVNKARAAERKARYTEAKHGAQTEFRHYKKDALFIAGLMAYVSGGDRTDSSRIRLTSTDAFLHRTFLQFAQAYLGAEKKKVRFWLLLYADLNEKKCMGFWSKNLPLSLSQFHKTQFIARQAKAGGLQHGTGNTIIGSTVLKLRLIRWIELLEKELS